LIDLINEMLDERKRIKEVQAKLDIRNNTLRSNSPGIHQHGGSSMALN